jgi:hypothetical protein
MVVKLLMLLILLPWVAACLWLWRDRIRHGELPPSMAELARER